MAKIRTTKVLSAIWSKIIGDKLRSINHRISGARLVALTYNNKEKSAYTFNDKGRFRIVIGGLLISHILDLPDHIDSKEKLKPFFNDIIKCYKALNYHEMGHILFTDMADPIIINYPKSEYRGFLHSLFNIIEDACQENIISRYMKIKFPELENPYKYFQFLKEQLFEKSLAEYEDNDDATSFLNYLLLCLRLGKERVKAGNRIYAKYESGLKPLLTDCLTEMNGTQRLYKVVKLGEWIIEHITEVDWKTPEPDPHDIISGKMPKGTTPIDGIPGGRMPGMISDGKSDEGADEDGDKAGKEEADEKDSEAPEDTGLSDAELEADEPENLEDLDDDVFSDIFGDGNDHEWVVASEAFVPVGSSIEDKVNETLDECSELSKDISEFLNLFNGRKRPRVMEGFTRGKLNVRRAMKDDLRDGCDTKLFNQKVQRGKQADVCVSLVCDNSGSMSGSKAELCFKAALATAQACDWSNVPFECTAFTKTADSYSGTSITIEIKNFKETLEKTKLYFGINSSSLVHKFDNLTKVPVFYGNSEEINLYYIGNRLEKVKHDKKIMFVFCDGCTTGSRDTLRKVIKNMEAKGIIVIGVGICDTGVQGVYSLYKVFNNTKELEQLGPYLIDTISRYVAV